MNRTRWVGLTWVAVLLAIGSIRLAEIGRVADTPGNPSPKVWVDSGSYARGGARLANRGFDLEHLPDLYHSPGQQIVVGAVFAVFGPHNYLAVKIFLLICQLLAALMAAWLVTRVSGNLWLAGAAGLITMLSHDLARYTTTLQYEPLVAFLIPAALALLVSTRLPRPDLALVAGLLLGAVAVIRVHFLAVAVVSTGCFAYAALFCREHRRTYLRSAAAVLGGFMVIAVWWNVRVAVVRGEALFFQEVGKVSRYYNHMNDYGYDHPYRPVVPPVGAAMIAQRPDRYLWLMKERWRYLWGFKADKWLQPVVFEQWLGGVYAYLIRLMALLSFVGGVMILHYRHRDDLPDSMRLVILQSPLFAVYAASLFISSSSRHIVWAMPVLAVFQVHGLREVVSWGARRLDATRDHPDR